MNKTPPTNRIFRIETQDGKGMYCGPDWNGVDDVNGASENHPSPHCDSKLFNENKDLFDLFADDTYRRFRKGNFIFGFSSIDQLRRWLYDDKWLWELDKKGFVLSIYEGDVRHGHTQVVINKETAVLIDRYKIADYFQL